MEILKIRKQVLSFIFIICVSAATTAQDDVIAAFRESYALEQQGDYIRAAERLNRVYQSDSYEMNLRLGWLYYQAGRLNDSENHYGRAIASKPYAIEPRLGMAYPLSAQARWDDLVALYNKILEVDPQNSLVNYRMGLIYYNRQNYERADQYLEKVINLYPFDYDTMLLLAWNKLALQKLRESRVLFNKVLMYNPGDESALEGLKYLEPRSR